MTQFNLRLGQGAFKAVYKGYDEEEGIEVAWCQVNMERVGEAEKAQIHTEVDILKSLSHRASCAVDQTSRDGGALLPAFRCCALSVLLAAAAAVLKSVV